jgi:hypothetical protein
MILRLVFNLIFALIILFFTVVVYGTFSAGLLYMILLGVIFLVGKEIKLELSLLFNIGIVAVLFFYWYWSEFYGSIYFLGKTSDDWQYDVFWSRDYFKLYGVNPLYLAEHLGILHNSKGYVYFVVLMRGFGSLVDGYHTFLPRFSNIFFLATISLVSYKITLRYTCNRHTAIQVLYLVFFFPVMLFNSVHVFRDTLVGLTIVVYFYSLISLRFNKTNLVWLFVALLILSTLRFTTFALLVMLLPIFFIPIKWLVKACIVLVPIGLFVLFFYFSNVSNEMIRLVSHYDSLNTERFGFLGTKIFSLPKVIGFIPRVIYLIFTPVPNFSSFHQMYASITALLQIMFFPILSFALMAKIIDDKLKIVFLIIFLGVALSSASFRHVIMYLPVGIIITSLYLERRGVIFDRKYFQLLAILFFCFFSTLGLIVIF